MIRILPRAEWPPDLQAPTEALAKLIAAALEAYEGANGNVCRLHQ